mgnify:CR=1 FL=1
MKWGIVIIIFFIQVYCYRADSTVEVENDDRPYYEFDISGVDKEALFASLYAFAEPHNSAFDDEDYSLTEKDFIALRNKAWKVYVWRNRFMHVDLSGDTTNLFFYVTRPSIHLTKKNIQSLINNIRTSQELGKPWPKHGIPCTLRKIHYGYALLNAEKCEKKKCFWDKKWYTERVHHLFNKLCEEDKTDEEQLAFGRLMAEAIENEVQSVFKI